jgi:hypothetical protein
MHLLWHPGGALSAADRQWPRCLAGASQLFQHKARIGPQRHACPWLPAPFDAHRPEAVPLLAQSQRHAQARMPPPSIPISTLNLSCHMMPDVCPLRVASSKRAS